MDKYMETKSERDRVCINISFLFRSKHNNNIE